jgi:hypothetical protein
MGPLVRVPVLPFPLLSEAVVPVPSSRCHRPASPGPGLAPARAAGIRLKLTTSTTANRILKIFFTSFFLLSFEIYLSPLSWGIVAVYLFFLTLPQLSPPSSAF